jgi:hypothetical protein
MPRLQLLARCPSILAADCEYTIIIFLHLEGVFSNLGLQGRVLMVRGRGFWPQFTGKYTLLNASYAVPKVRQALYLVYIENSIRDGNISPTHDYSCCGTSGVS